MRVRNLNAGAYNADGTVNINNFTATGPFYVYQEPIGLRDIASKSYVDQQTTSFDTAYFTTGTLAVARMPAFTGQIAKAAGAAGVTVNVGNTAAAGTYSSITVGSHGFVTSASQLSSADVPNFSWSKITSGKPTTLAGWGITNALPKSGGTLTGPVNVSGTVSYTNSLHAVTKSIADTAISGMAAGVITYRTGDLRMLPGSATPSGYLRCNGAVLSKTTYASLYAVVGDTYRKMAIPGAGRPWEQQNFNDSSTLALTDWVNNTNATLLTTIWYGSCAVVTKNRVYLLGGYNNSAVTASTATATVSDDGSIGTWSATANLPVALAYANVVVTKNYVYLLGGLLSSGSATNAIYKATINADGTLSLFTLDTVSLPQTVMSGQVFFTGSRVYYLGGLRTASPSVGYNFSAPVDSNGVIGAWISETNTLATSVYSASLCVTDNYVYLIGGSVPSTTDTNTVQYAPINADGTIGAWSTYSNSFPTALSGTSCLVIKNRVFVTGGRVSGGAHNALTYYAPINADGTLGSWGTSTGLTTPVVAATLVVTKNKANIIGGFNSSNGLHTYPQVHAIVGGLNDYSPYYDGSVIATPPSSFSIPTITANEGIGLYTYIKT